MSATIEQMQALHSQIARKLAQIIESGEATAAHLNVARAFLKDSGVIAEAVPGSPMQRLASAVVLPFAGGKATTTGDADGAPYEGRFSSHANEER